MKKKYIMQDIASALLLITGVGTVAYADERFPLACGIALTGGIIAAICKYAGVWRYDD